MEYKLLSNECSAERWEAWTAWKQMENKADKTMSVKFDGKN